MNREKVVVLVNESVSKDEELESWRHHCFQQVTWKERGVVEN